MVIVKHVIMQNSHLLRAYIYIGLHFQADYTEGVLQPTIYTRLKCLNIMTCIKT